MVNFEVLQHCVERDAAVLHHVLFSDCGSALPMRADTSLVSGFLE